VALTPDLSTVVIQGTYVDLTGVPISGSIRFTPQTILKDKDQNQIIINTAITKSFDGAGSFSVTLPVTSDNDVEPQPFAYQVEEIFTGGRNFFLTLPFGTPSPSNIADLAPAVDTATAANFITSSQYNTLLAEYTSTNASLGTITNIRANADAATAAATNATNNVATIEAQVLNSFLLMGL
jgi:hypothetical protein